MQFVLAGALILSAAQAEPGDAGQSPQGDLSWLEGCWSGSGLGGAVSECWMSVPDGRMIGAFQFVNEGELGFSEMLMIGEVEGVSGYHVKHFNPDFTGWEARDEQVSFPLVSVETGRAVFEGLIYERVGETGLRVHLDMQTTQGATRTVVFDMNRTD